MAWSRPLRKWQGEAVHLWGVTQPDDFLVVATPGAGKTLFSAATLTGALEGDLIDQALVVVPTTLLRTQWAMDMASVGIQLDSRFVTGGHLSHDLNGAIVTYAQIMENPQAFRKFVKRKKTAVVYDEIHHAGETSSWGVGAIEAGVDAKYRIHLSGTPFRTDTSRVAFLDYDDNGFVRADYIYDYGQALADGVVRPVVPYPQGADVEWRTADGEMRRATFEAGLSKKHAAERLRAVLEHEGWLAEVLSRAHAVLRGLRQREPDAGGLVVAMTASHARFIANILREVAGVDPAVVLSEDVDADQVLARFRKGSEPWLVAVRKVAEGVDVKRLRCLAYLTNAATELHFRQITGRIVRVREGRLDPAFLFLPADERLLQYSAMLEGEVKGFADPDYVPPTEGPSETRGPLDSAFQVEDAQYLELASIVPTIRTVDPFEIVHPDRTEHEEGVVLIAHRKQELRKELARIAGAVAHRFDLGRQDVYSWWVYKTKVTVEQATAEQLDVRVGTMRGWLKAGRCPVTPARSRAGERHV
jgi:superfamily II DNA or RNA helicase